MSIANSTYNCSLTEQGGRSLIKFNIIQPTIFIYFKMLRPKVLPDDDEVTFSELENSPNHIERDNNFSERAHSLSHERNIRAKSHLVTP
jgi:hypothetical protein